jgi:predicted nucleic acid-binding protein
MSGFLLDTNVISDPARKHPNRGVQSWMQNVDQTSIYISVFTLGEMRTGIDLLSDAKRIGILEAYGEIVRRRFRERILEFDLRTAERWGRLRASMPTGRTLPVIDSLLAATALHHDLTIVTRNMSDFESTGLRVINPFS